jgi:hypothetical protein
VRALELSTNENAAVEKLAPDHADKKLLFTELIAHEVKQALDGLSHIIGERVNTRAALSSSVTLKDETKDSAIKTIAAVRQHLYANLPDQKQDDDLRQYGFEPIEASGGRRRTTDPALAPEQG